MGTHYQFESDGGLVLPITEGAVFLSQTMSADYGNGVCYIDFYSDPEATVRADGGAITAKFESNPIPTGRTEQWQESADGDVIASAVFAGTQTDPRFTGAATQSRVTFSNVAGTFYARAWHWRE